MRAWLSVLLLGAAVACSGDSAREADQPNGATPVRIGWQTTWATQGQLAVVLMRTDILEAHGFEATFHGFAYGGPLNEGAMAGAVDVLFTADQPAVALASRASDWGIVGRLMANRVGTFVPPESSVKTPADLAGKTVAVPFGAAAHRATLAAVERAGLKAGDTVQVTNLGLQEIVALVGAGAEDGRWGGTDAAAAWDPAFAELEHRGAVRTIDSATITSVVVMDDDLVAAHPGADARFMEALHAAYDWYRQHPDEANRWFKEESDLPFDLAVLDRAAAVEPNLEAKDASEVRVDLSREERSSIQAAADFMHEAGLLKTAVDTTPLLRPQATRGARSEHLGAAVKVVR